MIWNFDSAKCRWHIVTLWLLSGSGLRLGMELLNDNFVGAWSECDLDSAHIFFVGVTVSKLTDWHRLGSCVPNTRKLASKCHVLLSCSIGTQVQSSGVAYWRLPKQHEGSRWLNMSTVLFELFANLGCLGWSAASRVCCMWQQHMWFRANSTYWKIVVAGKPAQPGLFQEETIWSLRRREQWEFCTWHVCANLENSRLWTNCVLILHPKICWPLPVCQWQLKRHGLPWPSQTLVKTKGAGCWNSPGCHEAICSATCFVIGVLLEHVNAKISCTALKYCVSHAEMVQRYSQEPWANFTAVSGTLAQVHVQCMNHCQCAACAACGSLTRNAKTCWIRFL